MSARWHACCACPTHSIEEPTERPYRALRETIAQNGHRAKTSVPILGSAKLPRPGRPPGALPRRRPAHAACFATSTTSFASSRSISALAVARQTSHRCAGVKCSTLLMPFPPRMPASTGSDYLVRAQAVGVSWLFSRSGTAHRDTHARRRVPAAVNFGRRGSVFFRFSGESHLTWEYPA